MDFNKKILLYTDGVPQSEFTTAQVIDTFLDCSVVNTPLASEVEKLIKILLYPEKLESDGYFDTLLFFEDRLVFCYQDNDFYEVEEYVSTSIANAIKNLYHSNISSNELKLYAIKDKLRRNRVNIAMAKLLEIDSKDEFLKVLNSIDFEVDKDMKILGDD